VLFNLSLVDQLYLVIGLRCVVKLRI